jgi:hypothetical protein
MRIGMNSMVLSSIAIAAASTFATADLVEFEGIAPPGGDVLLFDMYSELGWEFRELYNDDFRIVSATFGGTQLTNPTGDFGFTQGANSRTIEVRHETGGAFDFLSFDAAMLFGSGPGDHVITGFLNGGGTISQTITVPKVASNGGAMQTFALGWSDLLSVQVERVGGNYTGYDNFNLNLVPAPGVLAMFGLAGFAARRKRRM